MLPILLHLAVKFLTSGLIYPPPPALINLLDQLLTKTLQTACSRKAFWPISQLLAVATSAEGRCASLTTLHGAGSSDSTAHSWKYCHCEYNIVMWEKNTVENTAWVFRELNSIPRKISWTQLWLVVYIGYKFDWLQIRTTIWQPQVYATVVEPAERTAADSWSR